LRNDKLKHWIYERLFRLPTSNWEFKGHPSCNTHLHCSHFNSCSKFCASDKRHDGYLNPCIGLLKGETAIKEIPFDHENLWNNNWIAFDDKTKASGRRHRKNSDDPRTNMQRPDIVHKVAEDHYDVYEVGSGTEICHTNLLRIFNGECPFNQFVEYIDRKKQIKYDLNEKTKITGEDVFLHNIIITAIGKPSWRTSESLRKLVKIYNKKEGRKNVSLHQIWINLGRECVNASFRNFNKMKKEAWMKRVEIIDESSIGATLSGPTPATISTSLP